MQAWFGYFAKDDNSTKRPPGDFGDYITNVRFKEPTSTTHPVLIVEATAQYNYVLIGNKYYFVNEIIRVTDKMSEYHCEVDVLATFKSAIGESTEYVTRATRDRNPYIIDNLYPMTTEKFTEITIFNSLHKNMVSQVAGWFMVGIFGRGNTSGCVTYWCLTAGQFRTLMLDMFDISNYSINIEEISYGLQKALLNPIQYIASIQYFPFFNKPDGVLETQISFGFWNANATGFRIPNENRTVTFTGVVDLPEHHKAASVGNFLNSAPFTRRTLYCYMFGTIPIDTSYFIKEDDLALHLTILCDTFTGIGELVVSDDHGNILYKNSAQMGVNVEIAQLKQDFLSGATSLGGSLGALLTGNIIGATTGLVSAASSMMPQVVTSGTIGSDVSYRRPPVVVNEFYNIVEFDHVHFGRPLCKQVQIKNLENGFVQVENPKIELIATKYEQDKVKDFMIKGFYYE